VEKIRAVAERKVDSAFKIRAGTERKVGGIGKKFD
jgi:hypothetical protein